MTTPVDTSTDPVVTDHHFVDDLDLHRSPKRTHFCSPKRTHLLDQDPWRGLELLRFERAWAYAGERPMRRSISEEAAAVTTP